MLPHKCTRGKTYRIDGSKMEFRTADGALAATFERAK